MSVSAFVQVLAETTPARAKSLFDDDVLDRLFVLVHPDYQPPIHNHPADNRNLWPNFVGKVPLWAWINASADQTADVARIQQLDAQLNPAGYLLDIEGVWTKGAKLTTLIPGVAALGKPIIASLAGASASHTEYDFRTLDNFHVTVDWQAYLDSGEGPPPADAVRELYTSSFVIPGWEYRHLLGASYGWGRVTRTEADEVALFDSYRIPKGPHHWFRIGPRAWGNTVGDRKLMRIDNNDVVGRFMGRARYANIRVTLDVTRDAWKNRTLAEWTALAASARVPRAARRGVSVYLLESCPDDVLRAIAAGAP